MGSLNAREKRKPKLSPQPIKTSNRPQARENASDRVRLLSALQTIGLKNGANFLDRLHTNVMQNQRNPGWLSYTVENCYLIAQGSKRASPYQFLPQKRFSFISFLASLYLFLGTQFSGLSLFVAPQAFITEQIKLWILINTPPPEVPCPALPIWV